jgi:hypothetical protein
MPPNTACTPAAYAGAEPAQPPTKCVGVMMVGLPLRGVRVFRQFAWLGVGSGKVALSRPAHQGVTPAVGTLFSTRNH